MVETPKAISYKDLPPLDAETAESMNAELKISVVLAIIYYVFLLSVTILTWTAPGLMKTILWGGMSLTWFATSIVAMVMATLIAWLHVYLYQKRFTRSVSQTGSKKQGVV